MSADGDVWRPRKYIEPTAINTQVVRSMTKSRHRSSGIVIPGLVVAVLTDRWGGQRVHTCFNTVTNLGDQHYAEHIDNSVNGGMTFTNSFHTASGRMELGDAATPGAESKTANYSIMTAITASRKAIDTNYPLSNDQDSDNTGAGVDIVTWLTSYTTGDFNDTGISQVCIHDGGATPGASNDLLTYAQISPTFDKTSNDTLKMFVNHELLGQ